MNVLAELLAFVLDLAFDGVEGADEGQGLDRPRVARLGLDKVSSRVHPAAEMPNVVVHGVVAVVGVGVDEAAVTVEEPLREGLAAAGGEVEERVRILRVAEVDPGVGGPPRPQEQQGRVVGVDRERLQQASVHQVVERRQQLAALLQVVAEGRTPHVPAVAGQDRLLAVQRQVIDASSRR